MCFSAEASLVAGATLTIGGTYATTRAARTAPALLPFALYPVAFGLQQLVEGVLWLDLASGRGRADALALGFLFFSHFFWPVWAPFSNFWLRRGSGAGRVLLLLTGLGALVGALLFAPLLEAGGVPTAVAAGHISYATASVYAGSIAPDLVLLAYATVVLVPFALTGRRSIQIFGALTGLSMIVTYAFFAFTFISVWCFFAAVVSGYVVALIAARREDHRFRGEVTAA